jgi:retron-type reverse transcriptase
MAYKIVGCYKTIYQIPHKHHNIDQIIAVKPDGKKFYIPIADIKKIMDVIDMDVQMEKLSKRIAELSVQ